MACSVWPMGTAGEHRKERQAASHESLRSDAHLLIEMAQPFGSPCATLRPTP
ncbi:Hypothetical protein CAP_0562 [Chondromyces apiculatus DSM 436]|uniref:Uncharacterized protein n=1 Tax=Chondromyces apiculatus DSM 436 TaxID=1192034 RepID=A0A017SUM8_9BACT|nr:Hypothetical protein CAP_0562 [Chondromyces apiculatus DSM 436]